MARLQRKDIEAMAWMREQGSSVRAIARVAGCHESTVRYHLRRRAEGAEDGRGRQPEAVGPYAEVADAWIERQREALEKKERPGAVRRLYEELLDEGYRGSYKAVVRYVRRRMGRPGIRPVRRVEVAPGSLVQVDWAQRKVWVEELGGEVELYGFMAVQHHRVRLSTGKQLAGVTTIRPEQQELFDAIGVEKPTGRRVKNTA